MLPPPACGSRKGACAEPVGGVAVPGPPSRPRTDCQDAAGVLCPVLIPTIQERCGHTGDSPNMDCEDGQRAGEHALQGNAEGVTSFLCEEEKA
ncbi:hypothetical protein BTVI_61474 [Pitangus sulphuratus]|nr:hypothetical protein BTVI_61474 [Pitangus sulphuratus]